MISRADAIKKNEKFYFTGNPCKNSHTSKRYVTTYGCVACHETTYIENKDKYLDRSTKWYKDNPQLKRNYVKKHYDVNRDKILAYGKEWRKQNPEYLSTYLFEWRRKNPEKVAENVERRFGYLKERIPSWANKEMIKFFYECRPADCHVDHVIPLCGKNISGLHVETNLQWLPKHINITKGNRFDDE